MTDTIQHEIHNITEADFWSSLAAPAGDPATDLLEEAIRLGAAGDKEAAYAALARYHQATREVFRQLALEAAAKAGKLTVTELKRIIQPFNAAPNTEDAAVFGMAMDSLYRVALHVLVTGHQEGRAFLVNALCAVHRRGAQQPKVGRYPLFGMLGAHYQYQCCWTAYLALLHTGGVPAPAAEAAMKLLLGLGREMCRVTRRYMVHNIFTAACYGLFYTARTLSEFGDAAAWEAQALGHMHTDFERSFYPEGGHLERNWWYGFYTVSRLTNTWQFAARTGGMGDFEEHFLAGLRRAYRFFSMTLDAHDRPPSFGDEGGLRPLGEALDRAQEGVFPPGTPRDLGVDRGASYLLDGIGVAIMRNGAGAADAYANITFGEYAGWHSHQDLLSMNFRALGQVLIEEPPRFGPYEHPMDILWREPEAHNQLLVDTFRYDARRCVGEDVQWHSDAHVDYFSAYHTAYRAVPPDEHRTHHASADLIVRRTLVFVKDPGYLLVLDSVRPEQGDRFNRATSLWWHAPQRFRVLGPGLARTEGNTACLLAWAYPDMVRRAQPGDDFLAEEISDVHKPPVSSSWHSLRLRAWVDGDDRGCLGFATVLFPFAGKTPAVSIRPLGLEGSVRYRAEGFAVTTPAGTDHFVLNPERLPGFAIAECARIDLARRRGKVVIA